MQEKNPLIRGIAKLELNYENRRGIHLSNIEFLIDFIISVVAIVAFFIFFHLSIFRVLWWSIVVFILCFILVVVSQMIIGTKHGVSHVRHIQRHNQSQRVRRVINNEYNYNNYNYNNSAYNQQGNYYHR